MSTSHTSGTPADSRPWPLREKFTLIFNKSEGQSDADYESAVERDLPGREDQLQYYLYALDRRAQSTREIIKAGAMKTTDLISLIEKTDYIDYMSLSTLYQKMHGLLVLPTLSLGNVGEHSSLSLKLQSGELPTEDVEDQAGVATVLIKITSKDSKHPASFPTYAFELGKLLGTDNSGSSPYTYQTGFVVIVNAFTKQAWAVLNSEDDLGDQLSGVGIFPGLSTVTTVVDFGKTIDELLNPTQHALSPKSLALSANSFKYQVATLTGLANELARLTDELMAEGADEAGTKNVTNTTSGLAGNIHTQGTVPVDVIASPSSMAGKISASQQSPVHKNSAVPQSSTSWKPLASQPPTIHKAGGAAQ